MSDERAGEWFDDATDEWTFDDASDEWTEPMSQAGTDPFDTPVRPAREQPGDRADRRADRRGRHGVPGPRGAAAGRTGVTVGAIGGLATAVAVAASLVLIALAPAPALPAFDAPTTRKDTTATRDKATQAPDDPFDNVSLRRQPNDGPESEDSASDPGDDGRDHQRTPGSDTPGP